jgi:AcrR family transcriptional regulator
MPTLSDERRDERRAQILDAARACILESGLEAVSMEAIIARSGLSTGAVYRYYSGKHEIVNAVVMTGALATAAALGDILGQDPPPPLPEMMGQILKATTAAGTRGDVDLAAMALHGWSHSRTDPDLKPRLQAIHRAMRNQCARVCRRWQVDGALSPAADAAVVAQLMVSITLGYIAQRSLVGTADVKAHVAALTAIAGVSRPSQA